MAVPASSFYDGLNQIVSDYDDSVEAEMSRDEALGKIVEWRKSAIMAEPDSAATIKARAAEAERMVMQIHAQRDPDHDDPEAGDDAPRTPRPATDPSARKDYTPVWIALAAATLIGLFALGAFALKKWDGNGSGDANASADSTSSTSTRNTPSNPTGDSTEGESHAVTGQSDNTCDFNPGKPDSYWGPAGVAPQCVEAAAELFGVDAALLTVLNPKPGDDTVVGWVVGTTGSERAVGLRIPVKKIPAGTCVDFDPGASSINGTIVKEHTYHPKWKRVLLGSDAENVQGLKYTAYWTPCITPNNAGANTNDEKDVQASKPSTPTTDDKALSCNNLPTEATQLHTFFGTTDTESTWTITNFPHGWVYNGPEITLPAKEGVHHIDSDGGVSTTSGETTPKGIVHTVWFCE